MDEVDFVEFRTMVCNFRNKTVFSALRRDGFFIEGERARNRTGNEASMGLNPAILAV